MLFITVCCLVKANEPRSSGAIGRLQERTVTGKVTSSTDGRPLSGVSIDLPVISLDDIRRQYRIDPTDKKRNGWAVQEAKEMAKKYLRAGQGFIWNATNITALMRKQLIDLFVDYQAYVKLVYIEKPYDIWRTQNKNRTYPLPDIVLDKMLHNLEVPQLTEAHEVHYEVY